MTRRHLYVKAKDTLSLSLLQARLMDLKLPIKLMQGTYRCERLLRRMQGTSRL